jgi:hypothetical protein
MSKSLAPKKKGPKYLKRLHVTESLISAYLNLSEGDREHVEGFLALQVYGDAGMGHYTPGRSRRVKSVDPNVLCYCMKMTFDEPWSNWAKMIKKANLSEFERREAVRETLGALISQKNKRSLHGSKLREAAEKALDWTGWDENNCAQSRLRNSARFKGALETIASGSEEDRKAAVRECATMMTTSRVYR